MQSPFLRWMILVAAAVFGIHAVVNSLGADHRHTEDCAHCVQSNIGRRRYIEAVALVQELGCINQTQALASEDTSIASTVEMDAELAIPFEGWVSHPIILDNGSPRGPPGGPPLLTLAHSSQAPRAPPTLA